eukprot:g2528.t1
MLLLHIILISCIFGLPISFCLFRLFLNGRVFHHKWRHRVLHAKDVNSLSTVERENLGLRKKSSRELARTFVDINVPVDFLLEFLSNNSYAKDWSIFFARIEDLPPTSDGHARRRCYRHKENVGFFWDEEILTVVPGLAKRIYVYGAKSKWFRQCIWSNAEAYTDNLFEPLENGTKTRFTFSTVMINGSGPLVNFFFDWICGSTEQLLETYLLNMDCIKLMAEAAYTLRGGMNDEDNLSRAYLRPHPYDAAGLVGNLNSIINPNEPRIGLKSGNMKFHAKFLRDNPVLLNNGENLDVFYEQEGIDEGIDEESMLRSLL